MDNDDDDNQNNIEDDIDENNNDNGFDDNSLDDDNNTKLPAIQSSHQYNKTNPFNFNKALIKSDRLYLQF